MVSVWIKPYVEAESTPKVKGQIQGEEVQISEDELITRPEFWRQRIVEDFIGWLKGKPRLSSQTKLEIRYGKETFTVEPGESMPTFGIEVPREREIVVGRPTREVLEEERKKLWEEARLILEKERKFREVYWKIVEEKGRVPHLSEIERRL